MVIPLSGTADTVRQRNEPMLPPQLMTAAYRPVTKVPPTALAALTDALRSERRLLGELVGVLRQQRDAVTRDDLQTVEDTVFATHRVLRTMEEARRRRRSLNRLLGESDDLSLPELENALGSCMTDVLRHARDELEAAARTLASEVDINRRVLRRALATGQELTDVLCTPVLSPLTVLAAG
jgi:hypothetical protein